MQFTVTPPAVDPRAIDHYEVHFEVDGVPRVVAVQPGGPGVVIDVPPAPFSYQIVPVSAAGVRGDISQAFAVDLSKPDTVTDPFEFRAQAPPA